MAVVPYPNPLASAQPVEPAPRIAAASPPQDAALAAALTRWLREQGVDVGGRPQLQRLSGGMSHLTYRLRYDRHDLVLRRPLQAHGGLQRMRREFLLQTALAAHYPVPAMLHLCADPAVAGAPFYLMAHVPGLVPRRRSFADAALSADQARHACANFLDALIRLHRIDPRALDLGDTVLAPPSAHHLRKLLAHWLGRHVRLKTWYTPDLRAVGQWLIDRVPARQPSCLLHNDWRLDNLVFERECPSRIRAVLDWEFAGLGDPLMDLGIVLSYWIEAGDHPLMRRYQWQPSHLPGMPSRDQLVERYFAVTGRSDRDWTYYQVFGWFRYLLALQELHLRHALQGGEEKAFFTGVWALIHYLHWKCRALMRRG